MAGSEQGQAGLFVSALDIEPPIPLPEFEGIADFANAVLPVVPHTTLFSCAGVVLFELNTDLKLAVCL
jgi:hypothetical protein